MICGLEEGLIVARLGRKPARDEAESRDFPKSAPLGCAAKHSVARETISLQQAVFHVNTTANGLSRHCPSSCPSGHSIWNPMTDITVGPAPRAVKTPAARSTVKRPSPACAQFLFAAGRAMARTPAPLPSPAASRRACHLSGVCIGAITSGPDGRGARSSGHTTRPVPYGRMCALIGCHEPRCGWSSGAGSPWQLRRATSGGALPSETRTRSARGPVGRGARSLRPRGCRLAAVVPAAGACRQLHWP